MTNRPLSRDPPVLVLWHGGAAITVTVRRSARALRYTLRLRGAQRDALLTVPRRGSLAEAAAFAERHAAWLVARLARLPEPVAFTEGAMVPVRGVPHRIEHRPGARGTAWIEPGADGPRLVVAGAAPHVARRVRDHLIKLARADLAAASARHAAAVGRRIARITVRDARSRWGSCSASGRLCYSWRIILAPPAVLNYLAAHEVAHLIHMDHSRAFWALVARLCPEAATAKAWLKRHGAELHRYGA